MKGCPEDLRSSACSSLYQLFPEAQNVKLFLGPIPAIMACSGLTRLSEGDGLKKAEYHGLLTARSGGSSEKGR